MSLYRQEMVARFWKYQRKFLPDWKTYFERKQMRDGRPPVFLQNHASRNLLMNPRASESQRKWLVSMIPPGDRHRWFRSMTSSQALAQSLLGNLKLYDCLSCLNTLADEEGIQLFGEQPVSASNFVLEHKIHFLGERQPTSLDGFISGD